MCAARRTLDSVPATVTAIGAEERASVPARLCGEPGSEPPGRCARALDFLPACLMWVRLGTPATAVLWIKQDSPGVGPLVA